MKTYLLIILSFCFIAFTQADERYRLSLFKSGTAGHTGEFNNFSAIVSDTNGREVYRTEQLIPYDVPYPSVYLHPEKGYLVLCYTFDGFVDIMNEKGTKTGTINFFKGMKPNYERTITCALGTSTAVFLTSDVQNPEAHLSKYSLSGTLLWQNPLRYRHGFEVVLSTDEKMIAAGSYETLVEKVNRQTAVVSEDGEAVSETEILFRKAVFSPDHSLLILSTRDEVFGYETATAKKLWSNSKSDNHSIIADIGYRDKSFLVQTSRVIISPEGEIRYADPVFENYSWSFESLGAISKNATYKHSRLITKNNIFYFEADTAAVSLPF